MLPIASVTDPVQILRKVVTAVDTQPMPVAEFDRAPAADAAAELVACCASRRWVSELVSGRPHHSIAELSEASERILAGLGWPDVLEALQAHPRIGQRAVGDDRESAWSRQEQSAAGMAAARTQDQLRAGNLAYEAHFGYVFLICATGRSAEEVLANLQFRLGNDTESEQQVVRAELAKIVRLRLAKAFC